MFDLATNAAFLIAWAPGYLGTSLSSDRGSPYQSTFPVYQWEFIRSCFILLFFPLQTTFWSTSSPRIAIDVVRLGLPMMNTSIDQIIPVFWGWCRWPYSLPCWFVIMHSTMVRPSAAEHLHAVLYTLSLIFNHLQILRQICVTFLR